MASSETLTRSDLADAVYREVGLSRKMCGQLVDEMLAEISAALERGEVVKISSFGRFSLRDKAERTGRNPKTGEEVPISPRRVVTFRASHILKEHVNS